MILLGFGSFFSIFPYSRATTNEFTERVESEREKYLIMNFIRLVRELITAATLLLLGVLMKIEIKAFLYVIIVNVGLSIIFHLMRRIFEDK